MKTPFIYTYAVILVIKSLTDLRKVRNMSSDVPSVEKNERAFQTPKQVSQKVIKKTGTKVQVKGLEKLPDGPVLLVSNHQGLFDILVLLGYTNKPLGFIAKKEIKKLPIIRIWMELINCVFIDRSNRREAVKVINQGIENLKNGQSMVIFPEGTRSLGSQVNEFKPGSLRLGTKANVPIVPVAIDGTYKILEANNGKVKAAQVSLTICDAIYPDQYKDIKSKELASVIQAMVEDVINANKEQASA